MVQATCINGEVTVPTVTPKVTGFVTYELDPPGPYDPGTDGYTVTVTATLSAELVEWGQMPPGLDASRQSHGDVCRRVGRHDV